MAQPHKIDCNRTFLCSEPEGHSGKHRAKLATLTEGLDALAAENRELRTLLDSCAAHLRSFVYGRELARDGSSSRYTIPIGIMADARGLLAMLMGEKSE